jgi:hypothetical protein
LLGQRGAFRQFARRLGGFLRLGRRCIVRGRSAARRVEIDDVRGPALGRRGLQLARGFGELAARACALPMLCADFARPFRVE